MRDIKKFLKKLDFFGVNLNFKYQANDTYTTSLGGLFILIFGAVALTFGIYYFIPFINRENLSIIYYTMNIPNTEQIRLKESKAAFSIGFQCENFEDYDVNKIFNVQSRFVIYTKDLDGKSHKEKEDLTWHHCRYEDFYYKYNDSIDYLGLNGFQCLDDYSRTIEGIFSDQVFSYYEFAVLNKNKTKENFDSIYRFLSNSDCKLVIYYTDITIDLYNYKEPIKPFLDSIFIQLNPTLDIKRNLYFMNQYLYDDDSMFAVFEKNGKPKQIETLFSRYEEYALYMGLDFNPNNMEYAKIFIRADTKKTTIKRTYQKLTEFYADASSLLIALYEVLIVIFSYINNFYAEQSVTKRLFFFKELEKRKFGHNKRCKQILELMSLTTLPNIKNLETIQYSLDIKKMKMKQNRNTSPKNLRKNKLFLDKSDSSSLNNEYKENTNSERNNEVANKRKNKQLTIDVINSNADYSEKINKYINSGVKLHSRKHNYINNMFIDLEEEKKSESPIKTKIIKHNKETEKTEEKIKENPLNYNFNVFEIFAVTFCSRFLKGDLKLKSDLNNIATDLLLYKLDIHNYLRSMFIADIIHLTILDNKKKNLINFLSRPIISINKNQQNEEELFYRDFDGDDFDKVYDEFKSLAQKENKENNEVKLINLTNKSLQNLL